MDKTQLLDKIQDIAQIIFKSVMINKCIKNVPRP